MSQDDARQTYVRLCLELAAQGRGWTSPNPLVGCVIVRDGRIVGRGYHTRSGEAHAEIEALRDAGDAARGATLYVNLEPCCHFGKTPPCTNAILKAGIVSVVIGSIDPNPLVQGKGAAELQSNGLALESGILEGDCKKLNETYWKFVSTRKPFVVLKVASSLDGKLATRAGESRWISNEASRAYVHELRHAYDGIMVGIGTVLADDPRLTARLPDGNGRDPLRIVVDSRLRTPPDAAMLAQDSEARTLIAATSVHAGRRRALEERGAQVVELPADDHGHVDLRALMTDLGQRGVTSILLEGGATLHAGALKAGIVDKVCIFLAPILIGGEDAPGTIGSLEIDALADAVRLEGSSMRRFNQDLLIEAYPVSKEVDLAP